MILVARANRSGGIITPNLFRGLEIDHQFEFLRLPHGALRQVSQQGLNRFVQLCSWKLELHPDYGSHALGCFHRLFRGLSVRLRTGISSSNTESAEMRERLSL